MENGFSVFDAANADQLSLQIQSFRNVDSPLASYLKFCEKSLPEPHQV